ncbi:MAG: vanadium-dependent haloperoxidase [Planctomycetota bacterium]
MQRSRSQAAEDVRINAAKLASSRPPVTHQTNGEEYEYRDGTGSATPTFLGAYSKGLPHNLETGLIANPTDFKLFINGIQSGDPVDFEKTPLGPAADVDRIGGTPSVEAITPERLNREEVWQSAIAKCHELNNPVAGEVGARVRAWESASAGNVFDLQGPDAQAVTMPPAPRLDSEELLAEMAEVYAMALLRDLPFSDFPLHESDVAAGGMEQDRTKVDCDDWEVDSEQLSLAGDMLRQLPWVSGMADEWGFDAAEQSRRRDLTYDASLFRGQTPGENTGPYLSQFLLLGTTNLRGARAITDGQIQYGAIEISQRVRVATPRKDYMVTWPQYIDVQNGADLRDAETYVEPGSSPGFDGFRFMATPRDLATYVHYDALYEAYLNACLYLLASGAPFDRGIPFLEADAFDKQQGFAHFGGPHILSLVCEVATRALKAVRYQKFNVHRRLRPEAVGGRVDRWQNCEHLRDGVLDPLRALMDPEPSGSDEDAYLGLAGLMWGDETLLDVVAAHNRLMRENFQEPAGHDEESYLLPMAFPEGSPMHPSYGAGHGTVAGACVTILKAYFDHSWTPKAWFADSQEDTPVEPIAYYPARDGQRLYSVGLNQPLTVEGELNKLAANIAIGRNWAGVHYYSDYIESMRLGEQIAIEMLEEQKLTYPENFTMTVPLFDGGSVRI